MNHSILKSLLTLYMCNDPSMLSPEDEHIVHQWLNEQSIQQGFEDWLDAYHKL